MAYNKLSTANLPDPGIDPAQGKLPAKYFDTFLYTGNGGGLQAGDVIKKPADTTTISDSLVFNDDDGAYLSRTHTLGNRKTWTWSGWVKIGNVSANSTIFSGGSTTGRVALYKSSGGNLITDLGGTGAYDQSVAVFRDPSAWYHLVWRFDTTDDTDATGANRSRIYINGEEITLTKTRTWSPNTDYAINSAALHTMGVFSNSIGTYHLDGYLAEVHFIDGTAHDPTDFGNFDANGIWIPKTVTGITYGTNGFHLDFSDNTSTTTLGEDQTANGNDWTLNGFADTSNQVDDSPTDNIPYNISIQGGSVTISEGNLKTSVSTDNRHARSAMRLPPTGKWYWEAEILVTNTNHGISIVNNDYSLTITAINIADAVTYNVQNGIVYAEADGGTSYATAPVNNTVGVAFDADTGRIWFRNDSGWLNTGDPAAGTGYVHTVSTWGQEDWFPAVISHSSANKQTFFNFGQRAFEHTVPTGFSAMTENNITVDDQNLESPDFVWIKNRDNGDNHYLYDTIRGVQKTLSSDINNAEYDSPNALLDFNTNGFTVGNDGGVNRAGQDYVAWCWKANGSGVSNNAGIIPSTVSANTTSGFSIVKFIGDNDGVNTSKTIGHGLSNPPEVVIIKQTELNAWYVYHKSLGATQVINLDQLGAATSNASVWNNTAPDSDVFTVGWNGGANGDTKTHISYCFHSVDGFSKFGRYQGNNLGGNDGPFVYLGFQPALVILKSTGSSNGWFMFDNAREPNNHKDQFIMADMDAFTTEYTQAARGIDFVSNGFKLRTDAAYDPNGSGTYIYMAFAENPFKYSNAR